MTDTFQRFLKEFDFTLNPPADAAQLAKVEEALGCETPQVIRDLYRLCNGGKAKYERCELEIDSLEMALQYEGWVRFLSSPWGYFAVVENNDSNPICLCCKPPLAGYVVQVHHDDSPQLKYRDLDGFFQAAVERGKAMEFLDTVEFPPVFDGPERTSRDREVARQLMHLVKNGQLSVPPNSTHALLFACDLLAEEDETELGELLASPDDYVREHVLLRLNRSANSRCRKLVDEHNSAFGAFIERCVTFLKAQGITAVIHDHGDRKAVSLEPGPIWLNMEMFYARRDEAGFEDLFLDRVRSFLEGDKPKTKKKKKK